MILCIIRAMFYIPYNETYIKSVDLENKEINTDGAEDLIL